ncbi:hypothetical protein [Streptomyces sp. NPDC059862]|uniref:hypothetical protein n=1 Tax=unclassified Streptomyces TaxID=2593676 RepID=UPI003638B9F9
MDSDDARLLRGPVYGVGPTTLTPARGRGSAAPNWWAGRWTACCGTARIGQEQALCITCGLV